MSKRNGKIIFLIFSLIVVIIVGVHHIYSADSGLDISEENLQKIISEIFNVNTDLYIDLYSEMKLLDIDEIDSFYPRVDIFQPYFTEEGLSKFIKSAQNIIYFSELIENDIQIKMVDYTIKQMHTDNDEEIVFSGVIDYSIVFNDQENFERIMSCQYEATSVLVDNAWKFDYFICKLKQIPIDLKP